MNEFFHLIHQASPTAQVVKNAPEAGGLRIRSVGRRLPTKEMATPLHYSCWDNPLGRGD